MRRWFRKMIDLSESGDRIGERPGDRLAEAPPPPIDHRGELLSRDSSIRGLIAHADERYQSLDIRLSGMLERIDGLQRYLGKVLQYEAERDRAISEWAERMLVHAQGVLHQESDRVVDETSETIEIETAEAAQQVLDRLDQQSRAISYDLSVQEARIRMAVAEGQEGHAEILREQLRALDAIEADLTTELDDRLANLASLIGDRTASAVNEAAERVGQKSTEAVNLGVKDLLAVIDKRFEWLEETIRERMSRIEQGLGIDTATVIPDADRIEVP